MEKRFKALRGHLDTNGKLLSSELLPDRQLPVIMDKAFRFHSLGELINNTHLLNFMRIAEHNPDTTFTLWSKRKDVVANVLSEYPKPKNLILIYSTTALNLADPEKPPFFDKTFTVHVKGENTDLLNCSGKCQDCMVCYTDSNVTDIHERLK